MIYVLILKIKVNYYFYLFHNLFYEILWIAGPEYKQVTIWPTAELDKLKTELKNDGYLHITVPIKV